MTPIKRLGPKDYGAIFELSQFAFQYKLDAEELKKNEVEVKRHRIFGYHVEKELAGKLHIIPLSIYMGGRLIKMGGIASVATWPEYRRQGVAESLMLHALKDMKDNGETVSLLHPFHVGFYRKYGWELNFVQKHCSIPIQKLKRDWQAEGYIRRTNDSTLLDEVYADYAKRYNGMLARDETWWHQRVLTDDAAQIRVGYHPSGNAEAYIVYKVRKEVLTVLDFAYTSVNGLHLLYEFIGNHDSMAKQVEMTVPENDLLPLKLADPTFKQTLEPYFMARIVDVFSFLKQYPFTAGNRTVVLEVEDDCLPENDGCYQVKVDQGHPVVTKIKQTVKPDIRCSVQLLTVILFSFKRAQELYDHGLITGDAAAVNILNQMIPERQPFFADFF